MLRQRARRGAFTLVELLCVIAILTLLLSMLLPTLSAAREIARRAKCLDQYRQLGQALHGFAATHNERGPGRGYVFQDTTHPANWQPFTAWMVYPPGGASVKYMLEYEYFQTKPNATSRIPWCLPVRPSDMVDRRLQLACPSARFASGYGIFETMTNKCVMGGESDPPYDSATGLYQFEGPYGVRVDPPPPVPTVPGTNWTVYTLGPRLADFPNPSAQFAMWECERPGYDEVDIWHDTHFSDNSSPPPPGYAVTDLGQNGTLPPWDGADGCFAFRHMVPSDPSLIKSRASGIFLFFDGHSEPLGPGDRIMDPLRYKYKY